MVGAKARAAELEFFRTAEPWASSAQRGRFGTAVLVQNISTLLTQIIRSSCVAFFRRLSNSSVTLITLPVACRRCSATSRRSSRAAARSTRSSRRR